ncbi:hypothetical protein HC752_06895 [Vibrio sp. S9_S30]|uniref:hypothetical protein n=1 Tax=Vibrio sp. S9_S30 TaxID=2720226 RepID=UPI001680F978|nr:hypothetical protein [Vibrio sp. S9_S30]MBD1556660.1 hypothetical protein [Vibrio sp. S9_S30]
MDIFKIIQESWNYYARHIQGVFLVMIPVIAIMDLFYVLNPVDLKEMSNAQEIMKSVIPFVMLPLYQAALVVLFQSRFDGAMLTTSQCYNFGSQAFVRLLVMYILMGIAILSGLMLLIIPGVYLIGRFCLAEFYCVLEKKSYTQALSSSWAATKEYQWPILGGYILVALLQAMPTYFISILLNALEIENKVVDFFVGGLSTVLLVMITAYTFRVYSFVKDSEPKITETV